jgi:cytochrome P450
VILRIMGIVDTPPDVNRWADDLIFAHNPEAAARNLLGFLGGELEKRRANPGPDVLTSLTQATHNGKALEASEQLSMSLLLLLAGLDTTSFAIAGSVWYLVQNSGARKELSEADDKTWRLATDELVRWVSPVPNVSRAARTDTSVGGCPMHAGERVMIVFGSANRDATEFKDPDSVVFNRFPNRHVGFGMGPHRCAGSHLAKHVLQEVLKKLLTGLGAFRLADPEAVLWESSSVRGIRSLPLVRQDLNASDNAAA